MAEIKNTIVLKHYDIPKKAEEKNETVNCTVGMRLAELMQKGAERK